MDGGADGRWELVEPHEEPGATAEAEELDLGGRRRWTAPPGRWDRIVTVLAVAVAATAVIVLLVREPQSRHRAAPPAPSPSASASASVDLRRAVSLPSAIDTIRDLVGRRDTLQDILRQSGGAPQCRSVKVGADPIRAVLGALRRTLGPVTLVDSQRTIDQFAGLCALQLRARLGTATVGVSITAPPPGTPRAAYDNIETGVETLDNITTQYAQTRTEAGWRVLVGAVGRQADLPGSQALLGATQAPQMVWN